MARKLTPNQDQIAALTVKTEALHNICAILLAVVAIQSKNMNNTFQYASTALNARIDILLHNLNAKQSDIVDVFERIRAMQDSILDLAQSLAIASNPLNDRKDS
jgi:hypothetical protein